MLRVQRVDDSRAFAVLVRRWQGPIRRLCTRMTGDAHRGEDLAQETFARVFVHRKRYRSGARFSTFIWRIALNLCRDERRKTGRQTDASFGGSDNEGSAPSETAVSREAPPEVVASGRERARLVRRALLRLAQPYREVVVLRHYEGLKFREIAEVLEIPEGTVKSRMAEALSRLAQILKSKLGEETAE